VNTGPYSADLNTGAVDPDRTNPNAKATYRTYWEIFTVAAGGTLASSTDEFTLTTMAKSNAKSSKFKRAIAVYARRNNLAINAGAPYSCRTKGTFVQTGEAHFYEGAAVPAGFNVVRASPAGDLPYSAAAPIGLPAASSNQLSIRVSAIWDSAVSTHGQYGEPTLTVT
jgi:hypothetical protein